MKVIIKAAKSIFSKNSFKKENEVAKYDELLLKFSKEIDSIKLLEEKEKEISEKLSEYDADGYSISCPASEDHLGQVKGALRAERAALSEKIEMEYWDVPVANPRNQGINRFFELAFG